eukprot:763752-Hanusia_phi.AAC.2
MTDAKTAALIIGLGLSNQHTIIFYALPIVSMNIKKVMSSSYRSCSRPLFALASSSPSPLDVQLQDPSLLLRPHLFLSLCCWGLVGLLPYVFLMLAAANPPLGQERREIRYGEEDGSQGFRKGKERSGGGGGRGREEEEEEEEEREDDRRMWGGRDPKFLSEQDLGEQQTAWKA